MGKVCMDFGLPVRKMLYPQYLYEIKKELRESNYTESKTLDLVISNVDNCYGIIEDLGRAYQLEFYKYFKKKFEEVYKKSEILFENFERLECIYSYIELCSDVNSNNEFSNLVDASKNVHFMIVDDKDEYIIDCCIDSNDYYLVFKDNNGDEIKFKKYIVLDDCNIAKLDNNVVNEIYFCLSLLNMSCADMIDNVSKLNLAKICALSKLSNYVEVLLVDKSISLNSCKFTKVLAK